MNNKKSRTKLSNTALFVAFLALVSIGSLPSCGSKEVSAKTRYEELEKTELAKNQRFDTIFWGYYFGMDRIQFFEKCRILNQQKKITQGVSGNTVYHLLAQGVRYPINMDFFPEFDDNDKVYSMPIKFQYQSWAPWNPGMQSDSLQLDILQLMESWYGKGFVKLKFPDVLGPVYVKIDGNRRISIRQDPDSDVLVKITDLSVAKKKEANGKLVL